MIIQTSKYMPNDVFSAKVVWISPVNTSRAHFNSIFTTIIINKIYDWEILHMNNETPYAGEMVYVYWNMCHKRRMWHEQVLHIRCYCASTKNSSIKIIRCLLILYKIYCFIMGESYCHIQSQIFQFKSFKNGTLNYWREYRGTLKHIYKKEKKKQTLRVTLKVLM